jgi:hypothetical protein
MMKHLFALFCFCAVSCCLHAQVVDATVCEILTSPQSFNGKIVRVKATVEAGFDQFVVKGTDCGLPVNDIWLAYPEGSKAKAGPAVVVRIQPARNFAGEIAAIQRTPVVLDKNNKEFKQFDSLLATPFKKGGMCLGCSRYQVTATLVGRLDGVKSATLHRDSAGKITSFGGFGHMNAYRARLVLESVSEVTPKEIDYSKAVAITKNDQAFVGGDVSGQQQNQVMNAFGNDGEHNHVMAGFGGADKDTQAALQKAAQAFPAGDVSGQQLKRAVDALFGKANEHNGVMIGSGAANTEAADDEAKGKSDSPDGLLFDCTLNTSRLDGDAEVRALAFAGENVANLRNPLEGGAQASLYELENRAWVTTILNAVASRQKTLTLPGGYVIWNSAWPPAEANDKLKEAVSGFLANEEHLSQ